MKKCPKCGAKMEKLDEHNRAWDLSRGIRLNFGTWFCTNCGTYREASK